MASGIARCEYLVDVANLAVDRRQANAGAERKDLVLPDKPIGCGEVADVLANLAGASAAAIRQDDAEFVAAQAGQCVFLAQTPLEKQCHLAQ